MATILLSIPKPRIELADKAYRMLDIINNQTIVIDGIQYPTVRHAFYSLVAPKSANVIRGMLTIHQVKPDIEWEVKDDVDVHKIVLRIAMTKCKTYVQFRQLLLSTQNMVLLASPIDYYLGTPVNTWGFALMFIRDKRGDIDIDNGIDEFENYLSSWNDEYVQYLEHKNDIKISRKLTNIDRDRYEAYDGCYIEHPAYDGVEDAKLFVKGGVVKNKVKYDD